jgi:hypothetical protein
MAVSVVRPVSGKRMIAAAAWKWMVHGKQFYGSQ